jgi:hypothetical protein
MNTRKKIMVVLVVVLSGILIYYFFVPSPADKLSKTSWCVSSIYYKGRLIQPRTLHALYMFRKDGKIPCLENISFDKDGNVELPGIKSRAIAGEWQIDSNKNLQLNVDTLQYIFQGAYAIDINGNKLALKSKSTIINASRED